MFMHEHAPQPELSPSAVVDTYLAAVLAVYAGRATIAEMPAEDLEAAYWDTLGRAVDTQQQLRGDHPDMDDDGRKALLVQRQALSAVGGEIVLRIQSNDPAKLDELYESVLDRYGRETMMDTTFPYRRPERSV